MSRGGTIPPAPRGVVPEVQHQRVNILGVEIDVGVHSENVGDGQIKAHGVGDYVPKTLVINVGKLQEVHELLRVLVRALAGGDEPRRGLAGAYDGLCQT